jgi:HAD superfamily hydrolase (TIGR01509 family)
MKPERPALKIQTVVLDAMGVIYSAGDDVKDLLCPFILEKGGITDIERIKEFYISASLGNITSPELWKLAGIDHNLEDEYLQRYTLTDGLIEFLDALRSRKVDIWCLSNDVSEWSKKLRTRFGLAKYFKGFIISGDVGLRKPDPAIFHYLLKQINVHASDTVFVDDNVYNVDAAAGSGFKTILFGTNSSYHKHKPARNFNELLTYLSTGAI